MGRRFEGKVAIISGATSGIGMVTARRMAAEGARAVLAVPRPGFLVSVAVSELAPSATP